MPTTTGTPSMRTITYTYDGLQRLIGAKIPRPLI